MNEVRLAIGAATDVGKQRSVNEDSHGFVRASVGDVLIVCDGMGGHSAGDVASQVARDVICAHAVAAPANMSANELMDQAIRAAHAEVLRVANESPDRAGMGTTCVVAIVRGNHCTIGNVGDSRAYLIRGDEVRLISTDHTRGQAMVEHGIISEEELATHPEQGVLSQALGQKSDLQPAITDFVLGESDNVLLCTDGTYDCLQPQDIVELAGVRNPQYAATNAVQYAVEEDGKDNATAIVFRYLGSEAVTASTQLPAVAMPRPTSDDEDDFPPGGSGRKALLSMIIVALLAAAASAGVTWYLVAPPGDGPQRPPATGSTDSVEETTELEPVVAAKPAPKPGVVAVVEAPAPPEQLDPIRPDKRTKLCKSSGDCRQRFPCFKKSRCRNKKCELKEKDRDPDCCSDDAYCRKMGWKKCDLAAHRCDLHGCVADEACGRGHQCRKGKCRSKHRPRGPARGQAGTHDGDGTAAGAEVGSNPAPTTETGAGGLDSGIDTGEKGPEVVPTRPQLPPFRSDPAPIDKESDEESDESWERED